MNINTHLLRIKQEHTYVLPFEHHGACSGTQEVNFTDNFATDVTDKMLDLDFFTTPKPECTLGNVTEKIIEEISAWSSLAYSRGERNLLQCNVDDENLLNLCETYEVTIESLCELVKSIVNIAAIEEKKWSDPFVQQEIRNIGIRLDHVLSMQKLSKNNVIQQQSLLEASKRLQNQLTTAAKRKKCVENKLTDLQAHLDIKEEKITYYRNRLRSLSNKKCKLCYNVNVKKYFTTRESNLGDFEVRSAKKRKISEEKFVLQPEKHVDLDKWLRNTLNSQRVLRKRLVMLNSKVMGILKGSIDGENSSEVFIENVCREKTLQLCELYDQETLEIRTEIDVLQQNLSLVEYEFSQKMELCSFLEDECKILRTELRLTDR